MHLNHCAKSAKFWKNEYFPYLWAFTMVYVIWHYTCPSSFRVKDCYALMQIMTYDMEWYNISKQFFFACPQYSEYFKCLSRRTNWKCLLSFSLSSAAFKHATVLVVLFHFKFHSLAFHSLPNCVGYVLSWVACYHICISMCAVKEEKI